MDSWQREIDEPGRLADLAPLLAGLAAEPERLAGLLRAKEEQLRGTWFVESEKLWLSKLTWRLMRPLLVLGVLAAVGFTLQQAVDPTLGAALFLSGAAVLYVTIQFFAHLWMKSDTRELARIDERYRQRLRELSAGRGERGE